MRSDSILEKLKADTRYLENPGLSFDFTSGKWAVMFLNMGGPESLDQVESYLFNIFSDKNIIKLPLSFLLQKPLARMISSRRATKTRENYRAIGGGSPLLKWSRLAAEAVEKNLRPKYANLNTTPGMRYTPPFIREGLNEAVRAGNMHIMFVTLYPQYSRATTGTALNEVLDWLKSEGGQSDLTFSVIPEWYDAPQYIELLRERIERAMNKTSNREQTRLLFSAHSLPVKMIEAGDPYLEHVKHTAALAGDGYDYILSFQSRSGPVRWQGPETIEVIKELGQSSLKSLVIVPVSFVSDHIETLHEIDMELKELAAASGIEEFVRTDSFNDDPRFIRLLTDLIEDKIAGGHK